MITSQKILISFYGNKDPMDVCWHDRIWKTWLFCNFLRGLGWEVDLDKFMCKRIKFYSFEASMRPFIPFSIRAGLNFVSLRRMAFKNQLKKSTYLSKCWITLWFSSIFSSFIEKVLNILPFQGFPSSTRKFNIRISIS